MTEGGHQAASGHDLAYCQGLLCCGSGSEDQVTVIQEREKLQENPDSHVAQETDYMPVTAVISCKDR